MAYSQTRRRLTGRAALVTGASRGIGAAVVRAFVDEGAAVALAHEGHPKRAEEAVQLANELTEAGGQVVTVEADLSSPSEIERLVSRARAAIGPLDIVVANAAAGGQIPWRDIAVDQWDYVLHVNLRATWLLAKAAYGDLAMSDHAAIITVTSVMTQTGQTGSLHYTASKAGIIGLTRALARELGPDGIRVNAVMPGAIRTEHEFETYGGNVVDDEVISWQSLKWRGGASDIAGLFVFLASDDSAFMTGQIANADGGWVYL